MRRNATIFVIDDDEAVRRGLAALLGAKGYAVETFPTAEAFLARAAPKPPACLLADVRMPGMSGLDAQRLLAVKAPWLPAIIITGHGDIDMAVGAMKEGAFDFIEKPIDDEKLISSIAAAVGSKASGA